MQSWLVNLITRPTESDHFVKKKNFLFLFLWNFIIFSLSSSLACWIQTTSLFAPYFVFTSTMQIWRPFFLPHFVFIFHLIFYFFKTFPEPSENLPAELFITSEIRRKTLVKCARFIIHIPSHDLHRKWYYNTTQNSGNYRFLFIRVTLYNKIKLL